MTARSSSTLSAVLGAVLVALAAGAAFARSLGHAYLVEEDRAAVVENPLVRRGPAACVLSPRAGATTDGNSLPGRLSHALVAELAGPGPGPAHAANVLLHGLGAGLAFLLFVRAVSPLAAGICALAFALHPLQLGNVLWVSSRPVLLAEPCLALGLLVGTGARARAAPARRLALVAGGALAVLALVPWGSESVARTLGALPALARALVWPVGLAPLPLEGARLATPVLFLALAGLVALAGRLGPARTGVRALAAGAGLLLVAGLALASARAVPDWQNQRTLALAALTVAPADPRALDWYADDAFERGRLTDAADHARAALAADPADARPHVLLAAIALRRPRLEEAERELAAALAVEPDSAEANALLGETLFRRGDQESLRAAEQAFGRACAADPLALRARTRLALVRAELADAAGARAAATEALEIDPEGREAELALAQAALLEGDVEAARGALARALVLEPDYAEALTLLGTIELDQGAPERARPSLERAHFLHPLYPEATFQRARCAEALADVDGAVRLYRLALEQNPRNVRARVALAGLLLGRGERAEARELVEGVLRQNPDQAQARELLRLMDGE